MITSLLGFLGSSVFGTITGSLFAWLNKRAELAELKIKNEHEAAMATLQNTQALALADKAKEQVVVAGEQAVYKAEADAFTESQKAGNQKPEGKWAELLWTAVRPFITVYLLVAMSIIAYRLSALIGGFESLPITTILALYGSIINEFVCLTSYAVSWWFGARGSSQRLQKR